MLDITISNLFILLGAGLQTSAMLFRNQLVLRIMYIVGGIFYILYYFNVSSDPLWGAIFASTAIATSTAIGLALIIIGQSQSIIPNDLVNLYNMMGKVNPREFCLLMKYGKHRILDSKETLTTQGEKPAALYYIESGKIKAYKNDIIFTLPSGIFIGEIAFLTGAPASATVEISPGAKIVEWDVNFLKKKIGRKEKVRLALDALIARDLATKVANAASTVAHNGGSDSAQ